MKNLSILTLLFFCSQTLLAQEVTPEIPKTAVESAVPEKTMGEKTKDVLLKAADATTDGIKKVSTAMNETKERREKEDYFLLGSYSPLDLIIPGKYGITFGVINDANTSWELEYLQGSFSVPFVVDDLGKMQDERISLIRRSYFGANSFNFSYGVSYFDFSVHLGNKYMSQINSNAPSADLVDIRGLGFNMAVGNRWTFKHNITFGVDWISWAQPLMIMKKEAAYLNENSSQQSKDDVESFMNVVSYFPRIAVLKIQFGMLF